MTTMTTYQLSTVFLVYPGIRFADQALEKQIQELKSQAKGIA